jgi:hypothetical protein
MSHVTPPPMPGFPPPPPPAPPRKNRTNAIIIGSAAALIVAIVTAGVVVANARSDSGSRGAAAPSATTPAATPSTLSSVSPECRAWIRQKLQDSSDGIDAASGYAVCGDLTDEEMNKSIDEVTKEIEADPSALADATSTQAEKFQKCVSEKGTPGEKAAVKHVIKVTGADDHNAVADMAEVFTDYTGGMLGPHTGDGKLIASAFASCYSSGNGLVTVYDKGGDLLSTGNY